MNSVLFRTDASRSIGGGHVIRCLALADFLKDKGWITFFACRNLPGNLFQTIQERGHELLALASPSEEAILQNEINPDDFEKNLGVSWERDAQELENILKQWDKKPHWLVVDHYSLDKSWESKLRTSVERIFVIDDITNRIHDCDLLLNHTPLSTREKLPQNLFSGKTKLLLGFPYALLTKDYQQNTQAKEFSSGTIKRIFIFYGSADASNETSKAISALLELNNRGIEVDVVIGTANPYRNLIETQLKQLPKAKLHVQIPSLAPLMKKADLAMSAGGSVIYELLLSGVPTLVTTTADNQLDSIRYLNKLNYLDWLGHAGSVDLSQLKSKLDHFFSSPTDLIEKSRQGQQLVDGKGVERVVNIMESFLQ